MSGTCNGAMVETYRVLRKRNCLSHTFVSSTPDARDSTPAACVPPLSMDFADGASSPLLGIGLMDKRSKSASSRGQHTRRATL